MLTKPIIVYHTKTQSTICPDGFCAAMLYWRVYGNEADYVPIMYHQSLPIEMFAGRDVVFVDFSFNVDTMDEINAVANSLIMFDHHAPKAPSFEGRAYANFGKAECASVMVHKHLYQDVPMPIMIELIDDADRNLNMHVLVQVLVHHNRGALGLAKVGIRASLERGCFRRIVIEHDEAICDCVDFVHGVDIERKVYEHNIPAGKHFDRKRLMVHDRHVICLIAVHTPIQHCGTEAVRANSRLGLRMVYNDRFCQHSCIPPAKVFFGISGFFSDSCAASGSPPSPPRSSTFESINTSTRKGLKYFCAFAAVFL
jgi:hypothetical protein